MDPENSNVITFKLNDFKTRLSHQLAFQIATKSVGKNTHCTVLDKGASTSVMSSSCWRAIGSPEINRSPTTLKAFHGRGFQPYGLLPTIHVELEGKSVSIHIEVVDTPLDYNLLLGCNWFYAMQDAASTIFQIVQFPFQGNIVTIDQLDFITLSAITNDANSVPLLNTPHYKDIGVGLIKDSLLMGVFPLSNPPPASQTASIIMISSTFIDKGKSIVDE